VLIPCPECNAPVSDSAPACPRCGRTLDAESIKAGRDSVEALRLVEEIRAERTERERRASSIRHGVAIALMAVAFVVLLMAVSHQSNKPLASTVPEAAIKATPTKPRAPTKAEVIALVRIKTEWRKEGFDNIMVAAFTITNGSKYRIKDLDILCEHYAASGTQIDSNRRTLYVSVPAGGRHVEGGFNMGFIHSQAVRTRCGIVDLVVER